MNKTILSIAIVLMMGTSAFAKNLNDEVNQLAVQSFNKEFANAKNVTWEQKQGYVKVTFSLNQQVLFAYYNNEGNLTAVVRNLKSEQLPLSLLTQLKSEYTAYWISDLFEVASNDNTAYYVTIENADKKIVLRSNGTENWDVYSKSKKEVE